MNNENHEHQTNNPNPFAVATQRRQGAAMQLAESREMQTLQASLVVAQKFPRNESAAIQSILNECQNPELAEEAMYEYRKGGTAIKGPSIRLAEVLARNWGRISYGITELEQHPGYSVCQAYAFDYETLARREMTWTVPHTFKSGDNYKTVTDPRDIYELVANQGARRVRSCILGIIPGHIVTAAEKEIEKTLRSASKGEPIMDRIRKMVSAFNEYGVNLVMLEKKVGHKIEASSENELIRLRRIYTSLKEGASDVADHFDVESGTAAKAGVEKKEPAQPATTTTASTQPPSTQPDQNPPPKQTVPPAETPNKPADIPEEEPEDAPPGAEPPPEKAKDARKQYPPVNLDKAKDEKANNLVALGERLTESGISPEQFCKFASTKGGKEGKPMVKSGLKKLQDLLNFPSILAGVLNNWTTGADIEAQLAAEFKK